MTDMETPRESTRLSVPVDPRYARVVRMTAANIASIAGLSVEDVEDVRMAAEEAFVYACATGVENQMVIDFTLTDSSLTMEFELGPRLVMEEEREPALVYSAFILEAMCDECVIGEAPNATMRLLKKTGGDHGVR